MKHKLLELVESSAIGAASSLTDKQAEVQKAPHKRVIPDVQIGDTIDVHQWIELGEKGRIQVFNGVVIAMRGGGMSSMMTVRRIVQGEGVEKIFPLNSPLIAKIEVKKSGKVRRAKLYYLRKRVGKATRLKERKPKVRQAAPSANGSAATPAPAETKA